MRGPASGRRIDDLLLGVRLAVGGSRTPWGRLVLTSIGIGLGVAVLLLAASVPHMRQARDDRRDSLDIVYSSPMQDATLLVGTKGTRFRGESIQGRELQPMSPRAPLPDGLERLPEPGELVVSPALGELLRSPEGKLLKPRLPGRVVGVIGKSGLQNPEELYFYTGSDELTGRSDAVGAVVPGASGLPKSPPGLNAQMWITLAFGVTVLLVPIVVFVTSATRLAEAARERRLAALRLVGADGRQVRRIASGESLVGSVLGVALGWLVFLSGRQLVGHPPLVEFSAFPSDVWPSWPLAVAVTVGIPAVAVVTARLAMRRTIIEPLGVVRHTSQQRRRILWRLAPMVAGVAGLLFVTGSAASPVSSENVFLGSVTLLLVGVPLVLPWVIERTVQAFSGRSLTGQLALRRLRATSGTAARSVGAIAVVLTGVIGLQTVLASAEAQFAAEAKASESRTAEQGEDYVGLHGYLTGPASLERTVDAVRRLPATEAVHSGTTLTLTGEDDDHYSVLVTDCATVRAFSPVAQCRDGDAFRVTGRRERTHVGDLVRAGERLSVDPRGEEPDGSGPGYWRVPERVVDIDEPALAGRVSGFDLVLTPAAAPDVPRSNRWAYVTLTLRDDASWTAVEHLRNIAATHLEFGRATEHGARPSSTAPVTFRLISYGLLLGTIVAFLLIGCGLFVSAAEQVQERRRPMAVLAAVGARRRTLALSALLQNAIPMAAAMVVATVTGLGLGALVVGVADLERLTFDPIGLVGLLVIAVGAVLVVTALTVPALRRAMHPDGLHSE